MSEHNHENEEPVVITLEFDDGEEISCEPLFVFEVEGADYIALVPTDEESDDVYLYAYRELGEDEFELLDIEGDELYEKVGAEFDRIIEEYEAMDENE